MVSGTRPSLDRLAEAATKADIDSFEAISDALRNRAVAEDRLRPGLLREIAAERCRLTATPAFRDLNARLRDAHAAAERCGDSGRLQTLSAALRRQNAVLLAALRAPEARHELLPGPARALFDAIATGDLPGLGAALRDADPNARYGSRGETALGRALSVERRSPAVLRQLIAAGADPNEGAAGGHAPLHALGIYPRPWEPPEITARLARLLVEAGAALEAETEAYRWTPLHRAVLEGTPPVLEALLALGADPDRPFDDRSEPWFTPGRLPLQIAAADHAMVDCLLRYGARPHALDARGEGVLPYLEGRLGQPLACGGPGGLYRGEVERAIRTIRAWPHPS
ncbi:ankyrin repeat domain-containing protein [Rhodovulum sp. MB263]|uniref:ankyrin repeat domain-containing protein n=1 Tax=Rhodovulum sp. (strain MB263) TaxID=308754 RepID=UPI0009B78C26|nr:ankyrin repeat domain-containing protein [Rhodovulum sp. MB263]ARC89325.1 hypothetical protein B5V46_12255 [Rhodovulum sp. MB263]